MKNFSKFLKNKLKNEEDAAFKAREGLFELEKEKEYETITKIAELCGGCRRCGNCCKELPCNVDNSEISQILKELDISIEKFEEKYIVSEGSEKYLKTPCPFLRKDNSCEIYSVRPKICRWHPIKILLPFTYQIRTSKKCRLGHEIGKRLDQFRKENSLEEIELSNELREALMEFSEESNSTRYKDEKFPFMIVNSSTLEDFLKWLKKHNNADNLL